MLISGTRWFCLILGLLLVAAPVAAEDLEMSDAPKVKKKLRLPTLGGGRLWITVGEPVEGYRIQRQRLTGLHRLIDPANALITCGGSRRCQDALARELESPDDVENINVPLITLGGKQFWGDVMIYGGWRIQRNSFHQHYRLLDKRDVRQTWGTYKQCRRKLDRAIAKGEVSLRSRRLCVLVHGIVRSKDSLKGIADELEKLGYEVYSMNYPSTQRKIEDNAVQLAELLKSVERDFDQIDFVTHSLGGLVARRVLSREDNPKFRRMVMLAPPNQGAVLADMLRGWWPYKLIYGPAGQELVTGAENFAASAGVPRCEFGIIAGISAERFGGNPLISGDDDGVVAVENTKLEGMKDHIVISGDHTFIMKRKRVIEETLHFLQHGEFDHARDAVETE